MARGKKKEKELTPEEKLQQALVPLDEQPYEIPGNWCWIRMGNVAQWGSGGTPSRKKIEYYEGTIPWIKTGELNDTFIFETEEHITEEAIANSSAKLFPINTIVIAMYGATIGKVGIMGIEAATNQACACGICSPILYFKYLFFYSFSQKDAFISKSKGGAQPNISQEIIKNHVIPLPPIPEQQRIVDRIERLFAKLDEAKEKAQAVVDGFEDRKAAILHKAFTGELTGRWRARSAISNNTWKSTVVGKCITLLSGQDFKPEQYNSEGKGLPYITGASNFDDKHVIINRWTTEPSVIAERNDVLLVCKGSGYGKTIIADFDNAHIARQIMALRAGEQLVNSYLLYFLQSEYEYLRNNGQGLIPGISRRVILDMKINLPTNEEQEEIVSILDKSFNKEQQAKEAAEQVIAQIDTMKKSILARAFRGELGTNDPTDESSAKLLKRIL